MVHDVSNGLSDGYEIIDRPFDSFERGEQCTPGVRTIASLLGRCLPRKYGLAKPLDRSAKKDVAWFWQIGPDLKVAD